MLTILTTLDNFDIFYFFDNLDNFEEKHYRLRFWQLRTWIHDNLCDLTIRSDIGQHSQFLRCFHFLCPFHKLPVIRAFEVGADGRPPINNKDSNVTGIMGKLLPRRRWKEKQFSISFVPFASVGSVLSAGFYQMFIMFNVFLDAVASLAPTPVLSR